MAEARRANVVGLGLIGGSVGLTLQARGWQVTGQDAQPEREQAARELGAITSAGLDPAAEITFVATDVGAIPEAVQQALVQTSGLVTDVGSVKSPVVAAVQAGAPGYLNRFIGGHPMAGSEMEGLAGSRADMFEGATWVLTPVEGSDDAAYLEVRAIVASLGAEVETMSPESHDQLVALVSHVPHLTAATLMTMADERAEQRQQLLRLAAGGFRDMTRIAAGHPGIWPDICFENQAAICQGLDRLTEVLGELRQAVASGDRAALLDCLNQARTARLNLPSTVSRTEDLLELRVAIADRPGEIARLATLASELQINIHDLEITHSAEGRQGVMMLLLNAADAQRLKEHLETTGYSASVQEVS